jgi:hypothetical protein
MQNFKTGAFGAGFILDRATKSGIAVVTRSGTNFAPSTSKNSRTPFTGTCMANSPSS